jgi:hypothetical protein
MDVVNDRIHGVPHKGNGTDFLLRYCLFFRSVSIAKFSSP